MAAVTCVWLVAGRSAVVNLIGMSVSEILTFYREAGAQMFVKANLLRRLRYKFEDEPLAEKLRGVFGGSTTLGSDKLRTLLRFLFRHARGHLFSERNRLCLEPIRSG